MPTFRSAPLWRPEGPRLRAFDRKKKRVAGLNLRTLYNFSLLSSNF